MWTLLSIFIYSINQAAIGKDKIILLFDDNEIWQYKIYEKTWKKVINFICNSNDSENEYPVKIIQEECAVVLTNLGTFCNTYNK